MAVTLLCLATEKGYDVLRAVADSPFRQRICVCTFREVGVTESFDEAILELARSKNISILSWAEFRKGTVTFLKRHEIESIVCIGWRYLIPNDAIQAVVGEVVVAHDSLLPRLRGFAPLPTALIVGDNRTGVTFLRAGSSVDDGDILWQGAIDIGPADTIADLIRRVAPLYVEGTLRFLAGELRTATLQDHNRATYSIWRDDLDYQIDWSEDAERIERTVRALGPPYLGARTRLGERTVIVEKCEVLPDITFAIRQPGKIWSLDEGRPTVICGRGLIRITAATCNGANALPLKLLRQRFS